MRLVSKASRVPWPRQHARTAAAQAFEIQQLRVPCCGEVSNGLGLLLSSGKARSQTIQALLSPTKFAFQRSSNLHFVLGLCEHISSAL